MEEPESNPKREKLLKPMREAGFEFRGITDNNENELWVNFNSKKVFLYSIDNEKIIGPYDVKDKPLF